MNLIKKDPRWETLSKLSEKKQAFNSYKIQKQKDEKEEARLTSIKNREDLERFLFGTDRYVCLMFIIGNGSKQRYSSTI